MITIFDVPEEVRKNLPAKTVQNTLNLVIESLENHNLEENEIREIISSEGTWLGLMILSQTSYNAEKYKKQVK